MTLPLKSTFNKFVNRTLLVTALASAGLYVENEIADPGHSVADGLLLHAANSITGDSCAYAGHKEPLKSKWQKKIHAMYEKASESETGKAIMADLKKDGIMLCYSKALEQGDRDRSVTIADYWKDTELVRLNPAAKWDKALAGVFVHEGRHHQQALMNFKDKDDGNYLESDLVIQNWMTEADARLAAIVYAHEMHEKGDSSHMRALGSGYDKMAWAFVLTLADSDDMHEAMRAAIRAFRDEAATARYYDRREIRYLNRTGYSFDPDEPADTLLTDEELMKLGEMGKYGNYMNEELMEFIRGSFTMDDYKAMHKQMYKPAVPVPVS